MKSMVIFDTEGPYKTRECFVAMPHVVMPWSGDLEQRLDQVKRVMLVFCKGLQ